MIKRLNRNHSLDIFEFIKRTNDRFEDFYVTINKERKFFTDLKLIKKVVDTQEVYALYEKEVKGLLLIYREKGYRPYIKILAENWKYSKDLIKFLIWNFYEQDLYIKVKKNNPLGKYLQIINSYTKRPQFGFIFSGGRGLEILLFRKGIKKTGDKNVYNSNKDD